MSAQPAVARVRSAATGRRPVRIHRLEAIPAPCPLNATPRLVAAPISCTTDEPQKRHLTTRAAMEGLNACRWSRRGSDAPRWRAVSVSPLPTRLLARTRPATSRSLGHGLGPPSTRRPLCVSACGGLECASLGPPGTTQPSVWVGVSGVGLLCVPLGPRSAAQSRVWFGLGRAGHLLPASFAAAGLELVLCSLRGRKTGRLLCISLGFQHWARVVRGAQPLQTGRLLRVLSGRPGTQRLRVSPGPATRLQPCAPLGPRWGCGFELRGRPAATTRRSARPRSVEALHLVRVTVLASQGGRKAACTATCSTRACASDLASVPRRSSRRDLAAERRARHPRGRHEVARDSLIPPARSRRNARTWPP